VTGGDFYRSLVLHLASALQVRYAFVAECRDQARIPRANAGVPGRGELGENFEYDVTETPAQKSLVGQCATHRQCACSLSA
jgi:hypothetical protein